MARKIRIGFVGAGYMGQKAHLDNFVTIPDCEVVALAEGRSQTAEIVASKYGIPNTYSDHRAMVENEELDAVVAIMGYHLHHAVVPDLLEAGLHVLTEKPICIRTDTAREMAELADKKGVVYYVGYMKRSAPATQTAVEKIREWKQNGRFGQMKYLRAAMPPGDWTFHIEGPVSGGDAPPAYDGGVPEALPEWLDAETQQTYNAFVNYYIHQVNLIRYLLGEDYKVTYVDPARAMLAGVSDSGVSVVLEMQGYGLTAGWEETYRAIFSDAKIDLSIPSPMARQRGGEVEIFRGKDCQSVESPVVLPLWPFLEQARHFVRCVQGKEEPWSSPWDAVKDLEVSEQFAKLLSEA
ncbi:MAG TPA: Gfo/Idh/MocA family oxidoreductase [Armatimonadota bacterium]|nr:Gfo/Idh/MocA family oxidoreductase [Armatimonadota bacterium]